MKYVLITGGTSGIGLELAKVFISEGYGVAITSSNSKILHDIKQELEEKYSIKVFTYEQDMGKIGAAKQLYEQPSMHLIANVEALPVLKVSVEKNSFSLLKYLVISLPLSSI